MSDSRVSNLFFFFNDTATTEIYTLSLHDALPISAGRRHLPWHRSRVLGIEDAQQRRSEEHTSELQSPVQLVCRLLLEKKKHMFRGALFSTNYSKETYQRTSR